MQQYAIGTATGDILLINGAGKNLLKFVSECLLMVKLFIYNYI